MNLSNDMWCDLERASQSTHAECYEEHFDITSNIAENVPPLMESAATESSIPFIRFMGLMESGTVGVLPALGDYLRITHPANSVEIISRFKTSIFEAMGATPPLSSRADKLHFEKLMKTESKNKTLSKASQLIDGLASTDLLFKDLDKSIILRDLSDVFDEMSPEQMELSASMLQDTIKGTLVSYAASDAFRALSSGQKQQFKRATERGLITK
jgi:hypothetical protein